MNACEIFSGFKGPKGYGRQTYQRKVWLAHRLKWTLINGPIPAGLCVLHTCDNPSCINIEHLFLGTNADNVNDRTRKGRQRGPKGASHPKATLTNVQVLELRALRKQGTRVYDLALKFNVSESTVYHICSGYTWKA